MKLKDIVGQEFRLYTLGNITEETEMSPGEKLGEGATSEVHRYHLVDDSPVAVHRPHADYHFLGRDRIKEWGFQSLASIEGLVTTEAIAIDRGNKYLLFVQEELEGSVLLDPIIDDTLPGYAQRLGWLSQIKETLTALGKKGFIHRDLKAANVAVQEENATVFDINILTHQRYSKSGPKYTIGTPCAMSPEQVLGYQLTPASDTFAWGLLASLLLGAPIFPIDSSLTGREMQMKIANESLEPESKDLGSIPYNLRESVREMLSYALKKDPSQRDDTRITALLHQTRDLAIREGL